MNRRHLINLFSISLLINCLPMSFANSYGKSTSKSPTKKHKSLSNNWIVVGTISELDKNGQIFREESIYGAILVIGSSQNQKLIAVNPTCTHLGCNVDWETQENIFLCPCHASEFTRNGKVKNGPATKPLSIYETKVENNQVMVRPN